MDLVEFQQLFTDLTSFRKNGFNPLVYINGDPEFGEGTYIGAGSEVNAKGAKIKIGRNCDIASFVSINCADSHKRCLGLSEEIERRDILLEDNVFVGSHCVIKGGAQIGHHTVIASGCIVDGVKIPPYSLVSGNPMIVKEGYYREQCEQNGSR